MRPEKFPPLEKFEHSIDLQIRFNDIDILGHVNNTVYLSFFDTGKAYFFARMLEDKIDWRRVETVIANIDVGYVAPTYFGEEIEVWTRCKEVHEKSFVLQQLVVEKSKKELKACAETVMVCFNPETLKSQPVPDVWREALEKSMRSAE